MFKMLVTGVALFAVLAGLAASVDLFYKWLPARSGESRVRRFVVTELCLLATVALVLWIAAGRFESVGMFLALTLAITMLANLPAAAIARIAKARGGRDEADQGPE